MCARVLSDDISYTQSPVSIKRPSFQVQCTLDISVIFLRGTHKQTTHSSPISVPYVFSCDQAPIWLVQSVCLSVCLSVRPSVRLSVRPSVCHTFFTMFPSSYHRQGQRSKVKVTEVNTQLSRCRTLTPVWIHIWQGNHAHSWKQHRRGALLFFKVIRQISRPHGSKNCRIWPRLGVSGL